MMSKKQAAWSGVAMWMMSLMVPNIVRAWVGKSIVDEALVMGVTEETVVMLVLLPLVATVVSGLHYVLGLSGYGIFMPTMIAITFLATGTMGGLLLFGVILLVSIMGNLVIRKLRLHFWPSRAINLSLISIATGCLMAITADGQIVDLSGISIFPVLFMILLAEEFARTQLVKSRSEAVNLMLGTLILAMIGSMLMSWRWLNMVVLSYPEVVLLLVVVVNLVVGNYTGIRLSEIGRFKKAIRTKK